MVRVVERNKKRMETPIGIPQYGWQLRLCHRCCCACRAFFTDPWHDSHAQHFASPIVIFANAAGDAREPWPVSSKRLMVSPTLTPISKRKTLSSHTMPVLILHCWTKSSKRWEQGKAMIDIFVYSNQSPLKREQNQQQYFWPELTYILLIFLSIPLSINISLQRITPQWAAASGKEVRLL